MLAGKRKETILAWLLYLESVLFLNEDPQSTFIPLALLLLCETCLQTWWQRAEFGHIDLSSSDYPTYESKVGSDDLRWMDFIYYEMDLSLIHHLFSTWQLANICIVRLEYILSIYAIALMLRL